MLAAAPGGCWKGALPGAEGSPRRSRGRGERSASASPAREGAGVFPGPPSRSPRTAGGGEKTSGDTHGAVWPRSPAPSSSGLRAEERARAARGPPTAAPPPGPAPRRPPGSPPAQAPPGWKKTHSQLRFSKSSPKMGCGNQRFQIKMKEEARGPRLGVFPPRPCLPQGEC